MEVIDTIRTVLAVRHYQETPVPQDAIRRILEAGQMTGSAKNLQPWHFIVVENRSTLRQLGTLIPTGTYVAQAPLAIIVAAEQSLFALSDASRAIQSMIIAAWSEGIGSNWAGFPTPGILDLTPTKQVLGIPERLDVVGVISFGYPLAVQARGKKRRKSLSEVAHRERFGQPYVNEGNTK